jgi:glucokinase
VTALALDLGEDQVAVGITDGEGRLTQVKHVASLPGGGPDEAFAALADLAGWVWADAGSPALQGIGVAVSGPRPSIDGRVSPSVLPSWVDFPLVARLQDKHPSTPVQVHTQGDCFAIAERVQGAARGSSRVLGVLLNGNVDGGLVLDGRLVPGAAHLGHVVVDPVGPICGCGGIGCLAGVARGAAVVGWAREHGWVAGAVAGPAELAASARAGDPVAGAALAQAGTAAGVAIASVAALLDLDVVVVGGALADSGDVVMGPLRRAVERHLWLPYGRQLDVLGSVLGPRAGMVGAAALALAD